MSYPPSSHENRLSRRQIKILNGSCLLIVLCFFGGCIWIVLPNMPPNASAPQALPATFTPGPTPTLLVVKVYDGLLIQDQTTGESFRIDKIIRHKCTNIFAGAFSGEVDVVYYSLNYSWTGEPTSSYTCVWDSEQGYLGLGVTMLLIEKNNDRYEYSLVVPDGWKVVEQ